MAAAARVALVTCRELPSGDEDAEALLSALDAAGIDAGWQVWDDPAADWSHDLVVVRSAWDYTARHEQFLAWARSVPRLANAADVIAWNSDKTYLRDLVGAGVPVVATSWLAPGQRAELPTDGDFVLKPSIGAGSKGAGRFAAGDRAGAEEHLRHLQDRGRTVLVQPYLDDVDSRGETALIYLDGEFSHAVSKGAMLSPGAVNTLDAGHSHSLFVEERITAARASDAELAIGELVLSELTRRFGARPLYSRVDLLPSADGPVLVELELTEPSLFLGYADGAAERFALAIARRT